MAKEVTTRIVFNNDDFGPDLHFPFDMIIIGSSFLFATKELI